MIPLDSQLPKIGTKDLEVKKWDQFNVKLVQTTIQIIFTEDNYIKYVQDGVILRMEQVIDTQKEPELLTNMEQIKHFQQQGKYGNNKKKIGKWITSWQGTVLNKIGGYYEDGLKQGLWNQIIKNFWSLAQVYESGEYFNDFKRGKWKFIYKNQIIGGGSYNEQGQRNGKWIELSEGFYNYSQITYKGEYKNGKKVGNWDIFWQKDFGDKLYQQIGGGSYDNQVDGDSIKIGKWTEFCDDFHSYLFGSKQVTYNGEYKNGKKIGIWMEIDRNIEVKEIQYDN
ncbi:unnamed protein product [Paramecium primaurelia]|uniref:MORN repeat protein n=1 Tax=Paramecium primaurelia TaxID=5886 RepID=A0A8S1LY17_PARPR|nr:unnamed protein product [Paramecium primaurelia]